MVHIVYSAHNLKWLNNIFSTDCAHTKYTYHVYELLKIIVFFSAVWRENERKNEKKEIILMISKSKRKS